MKKVKQIKTLSQVEKMTKDELKNLKGGSKAGGSDLAGSVQFAGSDLAGSVQ